MGIARPASAGWKARGKCAAMNDDTFFPESNKHEAAAAALALCAACPVQAPCLDYALSEGIREGVWGNTTPLQRSLMQRGNKLAALAEEYATLTHGTADTAQWERHHGLQVCPLCTLAERQGGTGGYGKAKTYSRAG